MLNRNDNRFGTVEIVKKTGVPFERLRYWERLGIVRPVYIRCGTRKFRRYSLEDINRAILVRALVDDEKYSLEGAMKRLEAEVPSGQKITAVDNSISVIKPGESNACLDMERGRKHNSAKSWTRSTF